MNALHSKEWIAACLLFGLSVAAHASWRYEDTTDPMTSKTVKIAGVDSDNSLSLDFPYRGENRGHLLVRKDARGTVNVIVTIDKGQIICNSYDNCTVGVRFDEQPPIKFSATGPADHSSNVLFLNGEQKFINSAKNAKHVLVQLNIYQNGNQVLQFATPQPLVWGANAVGTKGTTAPPTPAKPNKAK